MIRHVVLFEHAPGHEDRVREIIAALNRAQAYIRTEAVKQINLRVAPSFSFKLDHSFDEAARVTRLLQQPAVRADIEKEPDSSDESGE